MKKFWSYWEKINLENRWLRYTVIILASVIAIQSALIYSMVDNTKVVVLPPKVDKKFWVTNNGVSSSYLEQVGLFIADRVLTVSPRTIDYNYDLIVPYLTKNPSLLNKINEILLKQKDVVKRENIVQAFHPISTSVYPDKILIDGILIKSYSGLKEKTVHSKIVLGYSIKDGDVLINSIEVE